MGAERSLEIVPWNTFCASVRRTNIENIRGFIFPQLTRDRDMVVMGRIGGEGGGGTSRIEKR